MVVMGLMFYKMAAGLCVYFIASSLWGLAERKLLPKKKPGISGGTPPGGGGGPPGGGRGPAGSRGPGGRGKSRGPKKEDDSRFSKVRNWWHEVLKQAEKK
jgi:YidC/Oxa1 family membrane protein insertase